MLNLPRTFLGVYAAVLSVAFGGLVLMGAKADHDASFDTINVHRINVREPDGTLRMVISDKARFPGLIMQGKETPHPRPRAGMLFYNDEATEQGGLIFSGHKTKEGGYESGLSLTFDRYEADQQLQLIGLDKNGRYFAGLRINDVPKQSGERLTQRMYVGKSRSDSSVVALAGADGSPRLMLMVTPAGEASILFMGADGKQQAALTAADVARLSAKMPEKSR